MQKHYKSTSIFPKSLATFSVTSLTNKAYHTATLNLADKSLLVFHVCPTDVIVLATSKNTPITQTAPFATGFHHPVNVTSTQTPGSRFPIGLAAINFHAVGCHGNGAVPCAFRFRSVLPDGNFTS
ncbi:MAG: hypothetical protein K9J37_11775 [Saprospiraceae bacterium]|nr:hypothetical protein [Saprospiraceae bacterium]MCF8250586.1 hypothetical protein [Saprospiraceae bacterium]MCF8281402.1 hypothetical protein [Bacteroidales bacterium]MCF8313095.1 hypothetical protein [Saprospiraceae bacterium]MCF8441541.1 hypothetical protein [Saprospiraceae bacterium]